MLILSTLANEMMSTSTLSVVTYSFDGSAIKYSGAYVVQSFQIDGKQRALPTMSIFNETMASINELQAFTFKILAAATGYRYSESVVLSNSTISTFCFISCFQWRVFSHFGVF